MKNLKNLLKTPLQLQLLPKWLPIVLLIIAFIGFADATFLTVKHYQGEIPPCTIDGCETVLTSRYSEFMGIPQSLFGSIYYLVVAILLFAHLDSKKEIYLRIALALSVVGCLASLYFIFLMAFIIKAFCQYCALSALSSISIFGFAVYVFAKNHNHKNN